MLSKHRNWILLLSLLFISSAWAQTNSATYPYNPNALGKLMQTLTSWKSKLLEFYPYNPNLFKGAKVSGSNTQQQPPQPPVAQSGSTGTAPSGATQTVTEPNVSGFGSDNASSSNDDDNVSGF